MRWYSPVRRAKLALLTSYRPVCNSILLFGYCIVRGCPVCTGHLAISEARRTFNCEISCILLYSGVVFKDAVQGRLNPLTGSGLTRMVIATRFASPAGCVSRGCCLLSGAANMPRSKIASHSPYFFPVYARLIE